MEVWHGIGPLFAVAEAEVHPALMLPFGLLLLCIAVMPFLHAQGWQRHHPKVAVGLGAVTVGYYLFFLHNTGRMLHVAHEYVSFIAFIGALFVVAGGIHIRVKGEATPRVNCLFLLLGAVTLTCCKCGCPAREKSVSRQSGCG